MVVKATGASAGITIIQWWSRPPRTRRAVCPNRVAINQTANTDILTSTNKIYICSLDLIIGGTETVSIVRGHRHGLRDRHRGAVGGTTPMLRMEYRSVANGGFFEDCRSTVRRQSRQAGTTSAF